MSKSYLTPVDNEAPLLTLQDFEGRSEGLIALTGSIYGGVSRHLLASRDAQAEEYLLKLNALFKDHLYVEITRHGMLREKSTENRLIDLAYKHNLPLVATNDAYFTKSDMFQAHDAFLVHRRGKICR